MRVLIAAPLSFAGSGIGVAARQFAEAIPLIDPTAVCTFVDTVDARSEALVPSGPYSVGVHFGSPEAWAVRLREGSAWALAIAHASHTALFAVWEALPLPRVWRAVFALAEVDSVLTPSEWMRSKLTEITSKPVVVVPHTAKASKSVANPLEQDKFTVLHLGQATPRKGLREAVTAFIRAIGWREDTAFVCKTLPPPPLFASASTIVQEVAARNRTAGPHEPDLVVYDDHFSAAQLGALYQRSSVLVANAHGEAFGLPALEAMLHGVPIIYTDWAAAPEVCADMPGNIALHPRLDEAVDMATYGFTPGMQYAYTRISDVMEALEQTYIRWKSGDSLLLAERDERITDAVNRFGREAFLKAVQRWVRVVV